MLHLCPNISVCFSRNLLIPPQAVDTFLHNCHWRVQKCNQIRRGCNWFLVMSGWIRNQAFVCSEAFEHIWPMIPRTVYPTAAPENGNFPGIDAQTFAEMLEAAEVPADCSPFWVVEIGLRLLAMRFRAFLWLLGCEHMRPTPRSCTEKCVLSSYLKPCFDKVSEALVEAELIGFSWWAESFWINIIAALQSPLIFWHFILSILHFLSLGSNFVRINSSVSFNGHLAHRSTSWLEVANLPRCCSGIVQVEWRS